VAKIIKGNKYHKVGRLNAPITHLMGTAYQNQHVGDVGDLPLHSVPLEKNKPKKGGRGPRVK
jgi:hypothetical protein